MTFTTIAAIAAGIIAFAAIVPLALPASKTVERTAIVEAAPQDVYTLLSSTKGFQTFNPYLDTDPNLQITPQGPEAGVGAAFAFAGKEGNGTQTITRLEENAEVEMLIDLGSMGQPVQTFTLRPHSQGTEVVWSVESEFGLNPIGRVFGLFMDGMLGPVYERGLRNLATVVAAPA
ncbi:MAG: SRPBCC family protein [Devosiaceae bacterium]|nr:SRPBCC family protein [Devosiaceae bacterium MH13]